MLTLLEKIIFLDVSLFVKSVKWTAWKNEVRMEYDIDIDIEFVIEFDLQLIFRFQRVHI
jgi:hypothetical protein